MAAPFAYALIWTSQRVLTFASLILYSQPCPEGLAPPNLDKAGCDGEAKLLMGSAAGTRKSIDARKVACHVLLGFVLGLALLCPVAMAVLRWFDPPLAQGTPKVLDSPVLGQLVYSFHPSMLPSGLAFGLLGALLAAVIGYYKSTIRNQKDLLGSQSERLGKLEQMNRRNTRFMVHDLKTHVGCILGFANLLLEQDDSHRTEESEEAIRRIRRQALMVMGNITELLHFAELQETGKLYRVETTVEALVRPAVEVFAPVEDGRAIVIGEKSKDCPPVWVDTPLVKRVLANLVSNSLKHNPGDIRVVLDAENRQEDAEVLFSVADNGSGIPADMADSLFEEFSTKDQGKHGSAGLGLAFCKATVEAHGGRIWCESAGQDGTRFFFTVPVAAPAKKEEGQNE